MLREFGSWSSGLGFWVLEAFGILFYTILYFNHYTILYYAILSELGCPSQDGAHPCGGGGGLHGHVVEAEDVGHDLSV